MAKKTNGDVRAVLVTTEHRGVFFGYTTDANIEAWEANTNASVKLSRARNCLYWPVSQRGFIGLASDGPKDGAKVGPAADIALAKITAIGDVAPEAIDRWENAPWK